jgi:HEAT repeat protein
LRLRLFVLPAILWACLTATPALAQSLEPLDADTQAALGVLRDLTPQGQATALAGMEKSLGDGELGPPQIPLLAALVETPAWTVAHRRKTAFVLAMLGDGAKPALERLASSENAAAQQMARDALALYVLIGKTQSPDFNDRQDALEGLVALAEAHPESADCVIAALAKAYTRKEESRREIRVAALATLVRFGEKAAPVLVESFSQSDPFFFQHTKAALRRLQERARGALLGGLNHREPLVRQRSIYTLLEIGIDQETAAALAPLRNDRDEFVRKGAVRALAAFEAQRP